MRSAASVQRRALGSRFQWDEGSREWRLATRPDGAPLVGAWPGLHLRLDQGRPVLVVPRYDDGGRGER